MYRLPPGARLPIPPYSGPPSSILNLQHNLHPSAAGGPPQARPGQEFQGKLKDLL